MSSLLVAAKEKKEKLEIVIGAAEPRFRIFAGLRLADPRFAEGSGEVRVASATQAGDFLALRQAQGENCPNYFKNRPPK